MTRKLRLLGLIKKLPLRDLIRIDAALEGDWSHTVTCIWAKKSGLLGFSKVARLHAKFRPSIELYFKGYWVGFRCFRRIRSKNVFDEKLATSVVKFINTGLNKQRNRL